MTDLIFEDARESDIAQIQQVASKSWRETYRAIYSPEYISDFLAQAYSAENLLRSICNPRSTFLVARGADHIEGFCNFGHGAQGPQLFRLYVAPAHWRFGIGSQLVHLMESRWAAQNVSEYFCYVHKQNEIGKSFYRKLGFVYDPILDHADECYMCRRIP